MPDEMQDQLQDQFIPKELSIKESFNQISFSIPVYQRPYRWEAEPVKQLWADIIEFYKEDTQKIADGKAKYFLGPVVTFYQNGQNQVIDGQQRITTLKILLFLLLTKLRKFDVDSMMQDVANEDKNGLKEAFQRFSKIDNRRSELEKCLWMARDEKPDYSSPLLSTSVISNKEKQNLHEIFLEMTSRDFEEMDSFFKDCSFDFTAKVQKDCENIHFRNRALLNKLIDNEIKCGAFKGKAEDQALLIISNLILNCCKMLTIRCDSQQSALKIFNTLNARGQLLSSSDILKAKIFGSAKDEVAQSQFEKNWTVFSSIAPKYAFKTSTEESSFDAMFRYLMHIYRSKEKVIDNTDPGLLKYFESENLGKNLMTNEIFRDLIPISKLWTYISNLTNPDFEVSGEFEEIDNAITDEAKKYLSVLFYLQNNPYWRHLVSNFFWRFFIGKEIGIELFKNKLPAFLKYLVAFTFSTFLSPVDYKNLFYKQRAKVLNKDFSIELMTTPDWWNLQKEDKKNDFVNKIKSEMNSNIGSAGQATRALLLLHAYLDPKQSFVQDKFDIEHIFPQNLKTLCEQNRALMNEYNFSEEDIEEHLQSFGNKMALEKYINISASDNPWLIKRETYLGRSPWQKNKLASKRQTQYQEALYLANLGQITKWKKAHIEAREKDFFDKIMIFFFDPDHDFSDWKRPDYNFESAIETQETANSR